MSVTSLPPVVADVVIDVSHHNGAIDWPALAAAGIALAFIKATQGASSGAYAKLVPAPPPAPPGRPAARPYDFHQYTPAGRVAGIATPVDRSVWVGSLAGLRAWYATGALPAEPGPPPAAVAAG